MAQKVIQKNKKEKVEEIIKVDIGCGSNKREGFIGLDQYDMPGVDIVIDFAKKKLPFKDNSVDEIHCSHTMEHLTNYNDKWERVHLFNEMYRVLKPGATATLIFPHWCSPRYHGDPTHKETLSEWTFLYLDKDWRLTRNQAPHADSTWNKNGYNCDFNWSYGYSLREDLQNRNQEYQQNALLTQKDAAQDIIATLTKK